ncbi:MAG: hypothetical protein ACREJ0_22940, partial [Geminicoccaceae bacterium]
DAEQHRRLFHWGQLQRCLLDAARLAGKQLASRRHVRWLRPATRRSTAAVLAAVERLSTGQNPGQRRGLRQRAFAGCDTERPSAPRSVPAG